MRHPNMKLSNKQIDEVVKLYNDGLSSTIIAERFDVTSHTIDRYLSRSGVPRRGSTGRSERLTDRQVAQVVSLYDDHTPTTVIAERFGVSRSTIYNSLRRSGIFSACFRRQGTGVHCATIRRGQHLSFSAGDRTRRLSWDYCTSAQKIWYYRLIRINTR